ncbi:MAG: MMPL family transporter, partial [Desulfocurvibacter africanus]
LSEFFDVYTAEKGRKESIKEVMHTLFMPMLYTSLTTAAGFFSLLTLDIPPARVFGAFVGVGILFAWVATILFIPAYIMLIPERMLRNFGKSSQESERASWLTRLLRRTGELVVRRAKLVLALFMACIAFSIWGISQITINDNYAKRFAEGHPIREADTVLNRHLGGTYTVSLILKGEKGEALTQTDVARIAKALAVQARSMDDLRGPAEALVEKLVGQLRLLAVTASSVDELLAKSIDYLDVQMKSASPDDQIVLEALRSSLEMEIEKNKTFKRPDVLNYMANMQASLIKDGFIGKSTSLADIVCKVHQELVDGRPENFRIPQNSEAVSECVLQYQQGHKPNDIWHFVTPDFETANIFMQFTSGDSMRTEAAVEAIRTYVEKNKPPVALSYDFAGLHYVNMIFQGKMFWGMLTSLAGSFVIVLFTMIVLFRSVSWGLLCMVPLSVTIMFIYGSLGFLGLDYDMPVAVLGAISLGIAVDFAIHFLERSRQITSKTGSWSKTAPIMFGKPARAISRNVIIIAFGFLPMLIAALVPYKTTGLLLFSILIFSGIATLLVLPAILTVAQGWFFKPGPVLDQSDIPTTPDTSVPVMARVDESAK